MAFLFSMRSTPLHNGLRHERSVTTLPVISEDGSGSTLPVPAQKQIRLTVRPEVATRGIYTTGQPFSNPDSFSGLNKSSRTSDPSIFQRQYTKRGGWKRLGLILVLVVGCVVGTIVGLVVGLRSRHVKSDNDNIGNLPNSSLSSSTTFPAGSYNIDTRLEAMSTKCTSNAATWRCYPYSTYTESMTLSAASFQWIIQPASGENGLYVVSSTNDPFSISFVNVTMTLLDAHLSSERYIFHVNMTKPVIPTADITDSNSATTCYFNSTILQANLYTQKARSLGANNTANNTVGNFVPWPYAALVTQTATSGYSLPECIDVQGGLVGNFSLGNTESQCQCLYMNYDL